MNEEEKQKMITETRKDFDDAAENSKLFMQLLDFDKVFFQIKLAFVSLVGVVFTIVFSKKEIFSNKFLLYLVIVTLAAFILLIIELWIKVYNENKVIDHSYKSLILKKIRHLCAIRNGDFLNYAQKAEQLLIQDNDVEQAMRGNKSIDEITKYKRGKFYIASLIFWSLIFISVPTLFLLSILNYL
jgi:hypothetical protein